MLGKIIPCVSQDIYQLPGFYLLEATKLRQSKMSSHIAECLLGSKIIPVEDH